MIHKMNEDEVVLLTIPSDYAIDILLCSMVIQNTNMVFGLNVGIALENSSNYFLCLFYTSFCQL
jgi:hypothetical protein